MSEPQRLLADFLRARRARLTPAAAGLPPGTRRRTPGLRREEVAHLAGLSPTWYTWLEQGREVAASPQALARLAVALSLTRAERAHLFELAGRRDPAAPAAAPTEAPPALVAAIATVAGPAYVVDRTWTLIAWNAAAARLFAPWLDGVPGDPGRDRNLLRFIFLDPFARALVDGWEDRARRVIAELRADLGQGEPRLEGLIATLCAESGDFGRWWEERAVLGRDGGVRRFRHVDGLVAFEQLTLAAEAAPGFRLVLLLPSDGAAPRP